MSNDNNPIIFAKPPKPVSQMTDEEIEQWARRLVTGMRQDNTQDQRRRREDSTMTHDNEEPSAASAGSVRVENTR